MTETIRKQILAVRDTGATNMFSTRGVQEVAMRIGCWDLAEYLADRKNKNEYASFILYGDGRDDE